MKKPSTQRNQPRHIENDELRGVTGGFQRVEELRSQFLTLGGMRPVNPTPPKTGGIDSRFGRVNK